MNRLYSLLRNLVRRSAADRELEAELRAHHLWTLIGVATAVLVSILLACYLPSLRATRVDPNVALRCE